MSDFSFPIDSDNRDSLSTSLKSSSTSLSSVEDCSDDESWKLNVAHVFFMQEKFKDCIGFLSEKLHVKTLIQNHILEDHNIDAPRGPSRPRS